MSCLGCPNSLRKTAFTLCLLLLLTGCEERVLTGGSSSSSNGSAENAGFQNNPIELTLGSFSVEVRSQALTISWDPIKGASEYHLYRASEPFSDFQNYGVYQDASMTLDVSSPLNISGLRNHQYGYYLITAVVDGAEAPIDDTLALYSRGLEPNANEVRMLELINRGRRDPNAEAERYNTLLNAGLPQGTISSTPKQALAFNTELMLASRLHSDWMLDNNVFSHTGEGGSNVGDRAEAAGYLLTAPAAISENLAWQGNSGPNINLAAAIDAHHEGLFKSPGHRTNTFYESFREIGVGQRGGQFTHSDGGTYLSSMLTNKFGNSGQRYFITGVAHSVSNPDAIYIPGSALAQVVIQIDGYRYAPFASGAYSILLPPGSYEFSVSVNGEAVGSAEIITLTNQNAKRDIVKHGSDYFIRSY